ncbi:YaaR family protein [Brevibacillus borstelensis]|uniref:YaaR family protein n=1 Tax=Brevibacillus borstelensis TaxID=45462 RepID=UPI00148F7970|nr:YaaR family protein [Brevibacillus borstelensis]MCM3470981.1 YaaR family protein [Brevibacillus borstelensis]MCM3559949.1 YaaR family protein [Brevibacillus borstelensis]NOU58016.1 YaaR family protein [Brevibacillus borstelensis]
MEVNKIGQISVEQRKSKQDVPADRVAFSELMNKGRQQLNTERLQKMIADIEEQGKILADSRTVGDLRKFKSLVKSFLDDAVKNGLSLEEQQGFNRRGRSRIFKIVKEVDKKLLELTDSVLKNQEPGLRILERVGEIKGLLVNTYA